MHIHTAGCMHDSCIFRHILAVLFNISQHCISTSPQKCTSSIIHLCLYHLLYIELALTTKSQRKRSVKQLRQEDDPHKSEDVALEGMYTEQRNKHRMNTRYQNGRLHTGCFENQVAFHPPIGFPENDTCKITTFLSLCSVYMNL